MFSNLKKEKRGSWFKEHEFFFTLLFIIILVFMIVLVSSTFFKNSSPKICGDSSSYSSCSNVKPYYCESGILVEKASICGCSNLSKINGDSCVPNLQTGPEKVSLKYILDGQEKQLEFTVYKGLADNLSELSRGITYANGTKPVRSDFIFKKINEEEQREFLLPLVIKIQNLTKNKDDQARIAISLVQNIQYGFSNKTSNFFGNNVTYSRYPYEVLYDSQGVCGEKSELLSFLLSKLGFGVVIFYNQKENHESVGIKCPAGESYKGTGFCFVETTGPSIITDGSIEYVGGIKLESDPQVILISDGYSLSENLREYGDAKTMGKIRQGKFVLFRNSDLEILKKRYGLIEQYNPA